MFSKSSASCAEDIKLSSAWEVYNGYTEAWEVEQEVSVVVWAAEMILICGLPAGHARLVRYDGFSEKYIYVAFCYQI